VYRSATDGAADGRQAGADFALELVGLLHERVRVRPTDFHGVGEGFIDSGDAVPVAV